LGVKNPLWFEAGLQRYEHFLNWQIFSTLFSKKTAFFHPEKARKNQNDL